MIKKGIKIFCTEDHLIATALVDIKEGDIMNASDFDWHQFILKDGETAPSCKLCGSHFIASNSKGEGFFLNTSVYRQISFK